MKIDQEKMFANVMRVMSPKANLDRDSVKLEVSRMVRHFYEFFDSSSLTPSEIAQMFRNLSLAMLAEATKRGRDLRPEKSYVLEPKFADRFRSLIQTNCGRSSETAEKLLSLLSENKELKVTGTEQLWSNRNCNELSVDSVMHASLATEIDRLRTLN